MGHRAYFALGVVFLCASMTGCSLQDFDSLENGDASVDATLDSSTDGAMDAADGAMDVALPMDAGTDAILADAGTDTGRDASPTDAGLDASIDANADAAYTVCFDRDGDGYGDPTSCMAVNMDVENYVRNGDDCDDDDDGISPETIWYEDVDNDNFGVMVGTTQCERPGANHVRTSGDCNDAEPTVNPGVSERCSTPVDDNCNGMINEASAEDATDWYPDVDGDGGGDMRAVPTRQCRAPDGFVSNASDCNDTDGAISATAMEICNGVDDNCDGSTDEGMTLVSAIDNLAIALSTAADGDVLCVAGSHTGSFLIDHEITVIGRDGPAASEMVGLRTTRVVDVRANATVRGFTIREGSHNTGAGVHVEGGVTANLENLIIRDNQAVDIGLGQGIGLYVSASAIAHVRNVEIRDNLARGAGRHGGVGAYILGRCDMNNVLVSGNRAEVTSGTEIFGVGVTVEGTSGDLRAENIIILGNHGEFLHDTIGQHWGTGLNVQEGASASITNGVIAGNSHVGGNVNIGVGACINRADATFINVINAFNTSELRARGNGYLKNGGGTTSIAFGTVFGNTSPTDGSSSDYQNVSASDSLTVDPLFGDMSGSASSWDVTLAAGSACIDAGNPALFDVDGSRSDMGAYGGLGGADW